MDFISLVERFTDPIQDLEPDTIIDALLLALPAKVAMRVWGDMDFEAFHKDALRVDGGFWGHS